MLTNYTSTTTYGITDDDNVTFTSTNYTSETIYSLTADNNITVTPTNYTSDTTFDSTADDNATLAFTTLRTSRGPRECAERVCGIVLFRLNTQLGRASTTGNLKRYVVALVLIFAVLVYVFASRHIRAKKAEVVMPDSSPRAMRTGSSASAQPEAHAV
ncbi:hypothetical protein OSTOST_11535 [Ostertagia ostertagi]